MEKTLEQLKAELEAAKAQIASYKSARLGAAQTAPASAKTVEKSVASKWGVKSLGGTKLSKDNFEPGVIHVNTAGTNFKYMSTEQKEAVKALKEANDIAIMSSLYFSKDIKDTKAYEDLVKPALKAMGIDSGDEGYEWIPTLFSQSYIDEYNLERKVTGLFQEIKMPSNPWTYPVSSNGVMARKLTENSKRSSKDNPKSDSTITLTAVKLSAQFELPEELSEDAAIDVMSLIRRQCIEAQEKALELAILEGDADGANQHYGTVLPQDSGTIDSDSPENAFNGLRKRAMGSAALRTDASNAVLNETHLSQARQKLGKFGVNPADLALICGPKGYNQLLQLDDVRTLEQYGAAAPVLSGELARYEGIPVIVSEYLREDTSSGGFNTNGGTNDRLSVMIVNRRRFFVGIRRGVEVKISTARVDYDVVDMVSFQRAAFQGVLKADSSNAATEPTVSIIYNIAAS